MRRFITENSIAVFFFSAFSAKTFAAQPAYRISEFRHTGSVRTVVLTENSVIFGKKVFFIAPETAKKYIDLIRSHPELKNSPSDLGCLPTEHWELSDEKTTKWFCTHTKAIQALNRVVTDLKLISVNDSHR